MPFNIDKFLVERSEEISKLYDTTIELNDRIEAMTELLETQFEVDWTIHSVREEIEEDTTENLAEFFANTGTETSETAETTSTPASLLHPKFEAIESLFARFTADEKLDKVLRSIASNLIATSATQFLPLKTGSPIDDPHMQKAISWFEKTLNNSKLDTRQRILAAEWLAARYLRRLPEGADMSHEYGQKALAHAHTILLDENIPPHLKKDLAQLIASHYESFIKEASDENAKKSKEYQAYITNAFEDENTIKMINRFVSDRNFKLRYLETDETPTDSLPDTKQNAEAEKAVLQMAQELVAQGKTQIAVQKLQTLDPTFAKSDDAEVKEMKTDPVKKFGEEMLVLGFWKTNARAIEKIKAALMDDSEHLCWSPTMDHLLKLYDQGCPNADKAFAEVVDYHLKMMSAKIPALVTALKEEKISPKELHRQISDYQYGSSGWIPLSGVYKELGCSHLRELYYLANRGDTKSTYRYKGFAIAQTAMADFYSQLAKACDTSNIENPFMATANHYSEMPTRTQENVVLDRYAYVYNRLADS